MTRYLTQKQAETEYGISKTTFFRWRTEKDVDIKLSKKGARATYSISENDIRRLSGLALKRSYKELYSNWLASLKSGTLTGAPVSLKTIENYEYGIKTYWSHLEEDCSIEALSTEHLKKVFEKITPDEVTKNCHYSKRSHIFKALMSFFKYLKTEGLRTEEDLINLKSCKPRRRYDPKRPCTTAEDFKKALESNDNWVDSRSDYDIAFGRITLLMLYFTAMRRAELADLRTNDIDLSNGKIFIENGKGGKSRTIGIPSDLIEEIKIWLNTRVKDGDANLLVSKAGKKVLCNSINKKISRIAHKAGVDLSPHSLRRGSATRSINEKVALSHVSKNLGHSRISTTDNYLRSTEDQAVQAMKEQTHWRKLSTNQPTHCEVEEKKTKETKQKKIKPIELLKSDFKIF